MSSASLAEPMLSAEQPGMLTEAMLLSSHHIVDEDELDEPSSPLYDHPVPALSTALEPQTSSSSDSSSSTLSGSPPSAAITPSPIHYSASSPNKLHPAHPANHLSPPTTLRTLSSSTSSPTLSSMHRKGSHTRYPSSSFTFKGFHRKHTPITLQFTNVSLTLPSGQQILSDVTGSFPHSRLIAIMGPSGEHLTTNTTAPHPHKIYRPCAHQIPRLLLCSSALFIRRWQDQLPQRARRPLRLRAHGGHHQH